MSECERIIMGMSLIELVDWWKLFGEVPRCIGQQQRLIVLRDLYSREATRKKERKSAAQAA